MTRLCGLNPEISYAPVQWAIRGEEGYPRVRSTIDAETTVTAYEMLDDAVRAVLILINAEAHFEFINRRWNIEIDLKGKRFQFQWGPGYDFTLREFIGYILDHGHCPYLRK